MKIKYKPWKNLYPTIDEVSIFWVSITRLLNKNNITLGIIWAIAVYIASNVNEINEILKALKVALDAMKVFLDKYSYILLAPTILIIFQAIKKYAQLKKHISLLQASTKYLSDSIQLNTIHVSHMRKVSDRFSALVKYSSEDSLTIIQFLEQLDKNSTDSERSLVEEYFLQTSVNSVLTPDTIYWLFEKNLTRGFKRFLNDIVNKAYNIIKQYTGYDVTIKIYLYVNVPNNTKTDKIFLAFIDDSSFLSEGRAHDVININNTEYEQCSNKIESFTPNFTPLSDKTIFGIVSKHIKNSTPNLYGYIEFDFSDYLNKEWSEQNLQDITESVNSIALAISENISYYMYMLDENLKDFHKFVHSKLNSPDSNQIPNFFEIIYKNFEGDQ
ncbi:TPA: hypothetical protein TY419_000013 [Streptococcus suis]|nr:hypothetical protein [Streptococcus suis]HEL2048463.1 hypothetical protein [Streptococcus suis]